jgi:hypothetical protein
MDSLDGNLGQPLPTYRLAAGLDRRNSVPRRIPRSKQFAANGRGASGSLSSRMNSRGVSGQVDKPETSSFPCLSFKGQGPILICY